MLGHVARDANAKTADAHAPAVFYKISTATVFRIPYRIKLYDSQLAPNLRRVRIFSPKESVEIVSEPVDIHSGQNRKAEFLEKNPLGAYLSSNSTTAPTRRNQAICRYFEGIYPEPPLMGLSVSPLRWLGLNRH